MIRVADAPLKNAQGEQRGYPDKASGQHPVGPLGQTEAESVERAGGFCGNYTE